MWQCILCIKYKKDNKGGGGLWIWRNGSRSRRFVFGHWLVPTKRRMMTVESGLTSGVWRQFTWNGWRWHQWRFVATSHLGRRRLDDFHSLNLVVSREYVGKQKGKGVPRSLVFFSFLVVCYSLYWGVSVSVLVSFRFCISLVDVETGLIKIYYIKKNMCLQVGFIWAVWVPNACLTGRLRFIKWTKLQFFLGKTINNTQCYERYTW